MVGRYELSESQWRRICDLLPGKPGDPGRTGADNRLFVNGVLWILRSGAWWQDLPERYGKWKTVHKRFTRWAKAGAWERVFDSLDAHDNLILCGPTGVGKSWLACALGHKACRDNRSVLYQRVPKLFADLALARGDGRYGRLFRALGGVQLLILDDWGLEPLNAEARHDLLEIVEERYGRRSTIVTSQIPVDK